MKQRIPLSSQLVLLLLGCTILSLPIFVGFFLINPKLNGETNNAMSEEIESIIPDILGRRRTVESLAVKVREGKQRILELENHEVNVKEFERLSADLEQVKKGVAEKQEEFRDLADMFFSTIEGYRSTERVAAAGETIPELSLQGGKVLTNLTVQEVDSESMTVRHVSGITRIPYTQLPQSWQKRFEFENDEVIAIIEAELERQTKNQ